MKNNYKGIINTDRKLFFTVGKSLFVGVLVGVVVVAYRWLLGEAESLSFAMYGTIRGGAAPAVFCLFAGLAAAGAFIGLLVRRCPLISGSGIPQVKGILLGYFQNSWLATLLAKFFGGALCIVAGLSLGREGPSIQLGACVADGFAQRYGATRMERKLLMASGASAGLAAAFNAPLAGVVFTLEEVFKYFSPAILLSAMTASVAADFVSKYVFGMAPIFQFPVEGALPLTAYWCLLPLGILLGLSGALYNRVLLGTQSAYKRVSFLPDWARPIVPFACAGVLGLCFPMVLGGGHAMLSLFTLDTAAGLLLAALAVKFLFSMVSFGSGAPGGIFFPLLVMGAAVGAWFGQLAVTYAGIDPVLFYNFVIISMAGFFAAIVRAPITGIVLIVEMTGSFSHMLSLTVVSLIAYLTADLVSSQPIYDSLLARQVKGNRRLHIEEDTDKKITFEIIVQLGSPAAGKKVSEVAWPSQCLLIAVKRGGREFIPKGRTVILPGDYLICLSPLSIEAEIRKKLRQLVTP
ncbi:ClC family H(+)/Cl(-) exchange transporter [Bacilliculturomica massiliensis]|uniref:ClC family H(+)/Cl(-) exchange transporter n=1 Tax=Bacilliculturomica massiliensis TaxID=1917867 RepID=UPI0010305269|nr:ClC family H(+)/Cl(-) exchange transporter [Bacilliculturomica massiliensis]